MSHVIRMPGFFFFSSPVFVVSRKQRDSTGKMIFVSFAQGTGLSR